MTQVVQQRRNQLIAFIQDAKDQNLINEFYRILRINFDDSVLIATEKQRSAIMEAQREIDEGKGISEEDADREIDEWLKR